MKMKIINLEGHIYMTKQKTVLRLGGFRLMALDGRPIVSNFHRDGFQL